MEERAKMRGGGKKVTAKRGGLSGEIEVSGVQEEGDSENRKRVRQERVQSTRSPCFVRSKCASLKAASQTEW